MVISQTPLRISLLGGGTDFPDFYSKYTGEVLTLAIDKYIYCIVKERFDDYIYINYSIKEIVKTVDDIKHDLVREAMKCVGVTKGVEITFLSDIPSQGSGLGSSSSVTVGILNALYAHVGKSVTSKQLAREACDIELKILKKPIGIQDQYIAAYGGVKHITFSNKRITVQDVKVPKSLSADIQNHIMVFFTGKTRTADTILKEQKENISEKHESLLKLAKLANLGKKYLEKKDFTLLGEAIHASWELKKTLAKKISDDEIDKMYKLALNAGAIGGKISGAGGGGFLTLIVNPESKDKIRKALKSYIELSVGISKNGSKIIFNINN